MQVINSIRTWAQWEEIEEAAQKQLMNVQSLPILHGLPLAVMPDVHFGIGATVGSVIPTVKAIIPAAVGVDIGCGMEAIKTNLTANDLSAELLRNIRFEIEKRIPMGAGGKHTPSSSPMGNGERTVAPVTLIDLFEKLDPHGIKRHFQLGTLGSGNHFIEICLDEKQEVWVMLHSGSRGFGNMVAQHFIKMAKEDMLQAGVSLPDRDLAYFTENTQNFTDYTTAVKFAQDWAAHNRRLMMVITLHCIRKYIPTLDELSSLKGMQAISCHHNYVERETHFNQDVWITRKGAISAKKGQLGIIPGSMGTKSYIVRGKGCPDSYCSASHGAGRVMSRTEARKRFSYRDLEKQTEGVECRKDNSVIDEIPAAYKDIDAVMAQQSDLVDVVAVLKQVMCVKGG